MRRNICFSMVLIFVIVSCAQTEVNLIPTPTAYIPVSQSTPIPLIYEPITSENASTLSLLAKWKIDSRAESIIFSSKQEMLCAGKKNVEYSWDLFAGNLPVSKTDCQMPFPTNPFSKITISPDNHYSAEIRGRIIYIVDLQNPITYLQFSLDDVVAVGFSSSGQYLVIGFLNGDVWFVDKTEWLDDSNWLDLTPELKINIGKPPLQILFSSNDALVAFLFEDQTIQVWSVSNLSLFSTINEGNQGHIYMMAFSSDESILATAKKNLISLWDIRMGRLLVRLKGHQDTSLAISLAFSPTDRLIGTLYDGYWVYLWGILPENLETAKISSTTIASSIINSTPLAVSFPKPTATPTSGLPKYELEIPLAWPVSMPTTNQILEARNCDIEALAKSRYHENVNYWELENAYPLKTPCDWAILAIAYQSRIEKRDVISEEGKRAFFEAVQQNPALAMNEELLYPYFDSFDLVAAPPLAEQPITSIIINYEWSGIGEPSHIEYYIEIENTQLSSDEVKISVKSQPEVLKNNLSHSLNPEKIQEIRSSLTDFLPVQTPFTLEPCTDNSPDWNITINFLNGKSITLTTHHSNLLTAGGPWFMELDGQFYVQFSSALTQAILRLFDSLGLPLGQPYSMFCSQTNTIELAFP